MASLAGFVADQKAGTLLSRKRYILPVDRIIWLVVTGPLLDIILHRGARKAALLCARAALIKFIGIGLQRAIVENLSLAGIVVNSTFGLFVAFGVEVCGLFFHFCLVQHRFAI